MLRFIIIVLVLASLSRRRHFFGFPFMGGWGYRRPPMGGHHGMGGPFGMGGPTEWAAGSGAGRMAASDIPSVLRGGEQTAPFSI